MVSSKHFWLHHSQPALSSSASCCSSLSFGLALKRWETPSLQLSELSSQRSQNAWQSPPFTSSRSLSSSSRKFPKLLSKLTCANWICELCSWQASLKTWVWRMLQVCWLSSSAYPGNSLSVAHMAYAKGLKWWLPMNPHATPFKYFRSWFTVAPKLIIYFASYTNIAWTGSKLSSATHNLLWIASTGTAI